MRNEWVLEEYTCVQENPNDNRKDSINSNLNKVLPSPTVAGILAKSNDKNSTTNTPNTP